jgi:hypothetical protein
VAVKQRKQKRKAAKQQDSQISVDQTPVAAPTPEGIVQLQGTIGNTAVQRLINDKPVNTIQRFGVGDLLDTVSDIGSSVLDFFSTWGGSETKSKTTPGGAKPAPIRRTPLL